MKLIFNFLHFALLWSTCENHYHLYHSHYPIVNNDHDCFYHYENNFNGLAHHLVPYCIRYNTINLNKKCLGTTYTFDQLHSMNITSDQLWQWLAPIDLIDTYAAYLLTETNNQQIYCNCSNRLSFGTHCQYRFIQTDDPSTFDEIIKRSLQQLKFDENDLFLMDENNSTTCYILFDCITFTGFCLDWREMNDGFIHCTNGEDEKYFLDMEISECNSKTEYRCRNGLCIPRAFLLDRTFDCPDRYDEQIDLKKYEQCSIDASTAECEEHKSDLNLFSCGDGQHLPIRFRDEHSCSNLRNAMLIKTLFRPYFDKIRHDPCNLIMLCHFNILALFEYFPQGPEQLCKELLSSDQMSSCPERFVFPPGPFIFPYVRLLYTSRRPSSMTPDFLCWNRSVFNFRHKKSNVKFDGFHCMYTRARYFGDLLWTYKPNMYTTTVLILVIQRLFSEYINQEGHKQLYKCRNSPLYISRHRINSIGYSDCFPWLEYTEEEAYNDANRNITCHLPDRYPCATVKTCIPRRSLGDGLIDCGATDDELLFVRCTDELDCNYLREIDFSQRQLVNYEEVCNSFDIFKLFRLTTSNDTDETNCEMWPCNTPFNHCNGLVERPNACDEINCPISRKNRCPNDEYYCASIHSTTLDCLPLSKVGDRHFDCLFGTDESTTLLKRSLRDLFDDETNKFRSFYHYYLPCWDHFNITIGSEQICDRKIDCPLGDDELFCSWHQHSACDEFDEFTCKDGTCISKVREWCNGVIDCNPDGEDERFCYLLKPYFRKSSSNQFLPSYSPFSFDRFILSEDRRRRRSSSSLSAPHCHRGIVIHNELDNTNECLCPPSYYGPYCQWQSERLTISYRINIPPLLNRYTIYWIVFYLLDEFDEVLTYETMVHTVFHEYSTHKQLIYLNYLRLIEPSAQFKNKSVQIDVYHVTNVSIELTSFSWFYFVQFSSFLPVTRLAAFLIFDDAPKHQTRICQEFSPCEHGACQIFLNTGNPFCRCNDGWYGRICDKKYSTDLCKMLNCNTRFGKCVLHNNHAFCLCTLGRMGPTCEIPFDACSAIKCQNNGICVSLDQRTIPHVCICSTSYFGNLCQHTSAQLIIKIPSNISNDVLPLVTISFLISPDNVPGSLLHRDYYFYRNVYPDTELVVYQTNQNFLSPIILAQLYFNSTSLYGTYYLLAISNVNRSQSTTEIRETYLCPHVNEHLNSSLIKAPWLKRIKFYPYYLKHLKCFYDEVYMCLVDKYGFPNCLIYNHNEINCTTRNACVNDGLCLQSKKLSQNEFICICPQCTAGEFCQIQLTEFSITLDSVIAQIMRTDISLNDQPITIKILLILISLMLIIGIISNSFSFLVFRHKEIRQIGCGYYLITLSIMNQITIIIFVARVVFLITSQIVIIPNRTFLNISCRTFDFILQVCISFCDWLHTCIACERAASALKGVSFNRKLSIRMVKFILPILSIQVILTSLHQIFNHDLTEDPKLNLRVWCVIKYPRPWLRTYEICINIFNNFIPFLINFICGIILLISLTIDRKRVAKKQHYRTIFLSQMTQHKDLLIAPLTMIITKLPLLIISFSIKCMNKQWHIYLSLSAYCLALLPLVATFMTFIWPSNSYMQKFKERFPCFK